MARAGDLWIAPPSDRVRTRWADVDLTEVAALVHRELIVVGEPLPHVWLGRHEMVPVVDWEPSALRTRLAVGPGPILDRLAIRELARSGFRDGPPSVLSLVGFIALDALPRARTPLARLSGYGRAVAAVPAGQPLDPVEAAECDYQGIAVASVEPDVGEVHAVVPGNPGPAPGSTGRTAALRYREEQMFQVALMSGAGRTGAARQH